MANDEDLFGMTDEELEAAFKQAKAEEDSPDVGEELEESAVSQDENVDDVDDTADEEVEVDEVEDTEQPEDDEDSEDTDDEDNAEDDTEEDSTEQEEENPKEVDAEAKKDTSEDQKQFKFKANGREYEFTDKEIFEKFPVIFGQAMDYTKKMQQIKPWRKTIDAIEAAKLGHSDVSLMIDVLKGDKDAIGEVLKRTGVDNLDLDVEASKYVPKDYGRNDTELALRDVVDKIKLDPEYTKTQQVLANEWDDASWTEITRDPKLVELLHIDMKNGMYDRVQPIAEKLKLYSGGGRSDLEYYKEAAKVYFQEQEARQQRQVQATRVNQDMERVSKVKADTAKQAEIRKASSKRKAAAPTNKVAGSKQSIDYLDDSDEAFEEWYNKLQESI